ncbi:helix-turn-helix transcriptional regulator [Rhodothermus sp. AH-315-K08]|nr:helix-turn-helix transcriptional regulator [Rhodothermus sp. AH-315-K08]
MNEVYSPISTRYNMLNRELTAATVKPAVLAILAGGESYGYEIIQRVLEISDEKIEWAEGALYPMLHRLERQGYIESTWRQAENGRKRKYYRLRAAGKKELDSQRTQWVAATSLLNKLLGPEPCLT